MNIVKTYGKKKDIIPNQNEPYFNATDALIDLGFDFCGYYFGSKVFKDAKGLFWRFLNMENFNTQIFSIKIQRVYINDYDII